MSVINNQIKNLIEDINKNVISKNADLTGVLEYHLLPNLSDDEKQDYNEFKEILLKFKQNLEVISKESTITQKIKQHKDIGQDRPLTEEEQKVANNILLVLERQILISIVLRAILNKDVKLNKIHQEFGKYTISNFYRTLCECSLRLFTDNLILILKIEMSDVNNIDADNLQKKLKSIFNNSIGLDDLRSILGTFDKRLSYKIGLVKLIDKVFLYKENEGFSLRNNIAHEKIFFNDMDANFIVQELKKVSNFNVAFVLIFYFGDLGKYFEKKDIDLSKNIFDLK